MQKALPTSIVVLLGLSWSPSKGNTVRLTSRRAAGCHFGGDGLAAQDGPEDLMDTVHPMGGLYYGYRRYLPSTLSRILLYLRSADQ